MGKPLLKDEITPLRQPCPFGGSIAHVMLRYDVYEKRPVFLQLVIKHYRNRGAQRQGKAPGASGIRIIPTMPSKCVLWNTMLIIFRRMPGRTGN